MDRGYIYVNKTNYLNNINYLRSLSDKELCLVVKANGYGHGIEWAVKTAIEGGVKWFAVAAINEAIKVRSVSDNVRILLLTEPSLSEIDKVEFLEITTSSLSLFLTLLISSEKIQSHRFC